MTKHLLTRGDDLATIQAVNQCWRGLLGSHHSPFCGRVEFISPSNAGGK
jgi:hypothetical protein